jgi:mannose-6-phosphate isomerase-like protein (cupin superfamily)
MAYVQDYREHVGAREGKHHKATLFQSPKLLLGLNCLEPGQVQSVHTHADQDKFYAVQEGRGLFTVGSETFEAGPASVVWAPAGIDHGVRNEGSERLVLLVGIAPAPG